MLSLQKHPAQKCTHARTLDIKNAEHIALLSNKVFFVFSHFPSDILGEEERNEERKRLLIKSDCTVRCANTTKSKFTALLNKIRRRPSFLHICAVRVLHIQQCSQIQFYCIGNKFKLNFILIKKKRKDQLKLYSKVFQ